LQHSAPPPPSAMIPSTPGRSDPLLRAPQSGPRLSPVWRPFGRVRPSF
jgi:hypothetical protein